MRPLSCVVAVMLVLMMNPSASLAQPSALQVPGSWLASSGAGQTVPEYPVPGRCIGDGVRLRAEPAVEAEVLGHVDQQDFLYVLSERLVDGETWYEVDHPARAESAWISGRYLETDRTGSVAPAHALVWRVELDFGATLVKARALFGEPLRSGIDMVRVEAAAQETPAVTFVYPLHTARYVDGRLSKVHVAAKGMGFGPFHVGDPAEKVTELLGAPDEERDGGLIYHGDAGPSREFLFGLKDGVVRELIYIHWSE